MGDISPFHADYLNLEKHINWCYETQMLDKLI